MRLITSVGPRSRTPEDDHRLASRPGTGAGLHLHPSRRRWALYDHGGPRGMRGAAAPGGPRDGTPWDGNREAEGAPAVRRSRRQSFPASAGESIHPFMLGHSLFHGATRPWHKSAGRRERLGVHVDPDDRSVLARHARPTAT